MKRIGEIDISTLKEYLKLRENKEHFEKELEKIKSTLDSISREIKDIETTGEIYKPQFNSDDIPF